MLETSFSCQESFLLPLAGPGSYFSVLGACHCTYDPYMAPISLFFLEVQKTESERQIWSSGVPPFYKNSLGSVVLKRKARCHYIWDVTPWNTVSDEAEELFLPQSTLLLSMLFLLSPAPFKQQDLPSFTVQLN